MGSRAARCQAHGRDHPALARVSQIPGLIPTRWWRWCCSSPGWHMPWVPRACSAVRRRPWRCRGASSSPWVSRLPPIRSSRTIWSTDEPISICHADLFSSWSPVAQPGAIDWSSPFICPFSLALFALAVAGKMPGVVPDPRNPAHAPSPSALPWCRAARSDWIFAEPGRASGVFQQRNLRGHGAGDRFIHPVAAISC